MNDQKITIKYISVGIIAVIFTWLIHEFSHWLTSELFGYETIMRLNGTSVVGGENPSDLHRAIISIAGPIITILQGLVFFLVLKFQGWNKYLYPFLFTAFYMRFLAGLMNFNNVNDEGRVSQFLGLWAFTLSIIISGLLLYMVYKISSQYKLNWKFQLGTVLLVMFTSSIVILSDQFLVVRIL